MIALFSWPLFWREALRQGCGNKSSQLVIGDVMAAVVWLVRVLAGLGAAGAALGIALGLFQDFHPALDSFSHFRLHFVAVLLLCCLISAVLRSGKARWLCLAVVVLCGVWLWGQGSKGPPRDGPRGDLRLVQFNLNFRNPVMDRVGEALTALDADIVTLQEVTPDHEAALRELRAYPHQAHCFFRDYVGGVSILSKHALSGVECAEGQGLVLGSVDAPGGALTVASIHTLWPWPYNQHAQVDAWLPRLSEIIGPVIVAGDFNAAPWSHAVAKVAAASRSKVLPGVRMTIGVLGVPIPIDHALLSDELCGLSARVGPDIGSDHYPVIVEIERTDPSLLGGCGQR